MQKKVLFSIFILSSITNLSFGMENTQNLLSHFPLVCCALGGKIYHDGPVFCCYYPDMCKKVCCGDESTSPDIELKAPLESNEGGTIKSLTLYDPGCCCNKSRCVKGLKKQFGVGSEKCECPNLPFLLTLGCCCGSCCLDHKGHIIPCAGLATCAGDHCLWCVCMDGKCNCCDCCGGTCQIYGTHWEWECCCTKWRDLDINDPDYCCCFNSNKEYSSGQYTACSNSPVCCVATLLIAKYGFGIPIPIPGLP